MPEYAIGMCYHEPLSYALWELGLIKDYEASTCLFVEAHSVEAAMEWAEKVATALLRHANRGETLDWKGLGYFCWQEDEFDTSGWAHCRDFFQHVRDGQWPDIERMTTEAYVAWMKQRDADPHSDPPNRDSNTE